MVRTVIHADMDAFYASVEQLDRPELRGKPVVVGGRPEARGVVAAASYEARRFGVRSAMPMVRALRLCPQAVRVPPRFDRYAELSRQVMSVFRSLSPLVEPLSLDEAFIELTDDVESYGGQRALAASLKARVKQATGLTVSVGVGTNKTVAKIASDIGKPDGLVVIPPGAEAAFLDPLPVRALWGIGPKAEAALASAAVRTVGDLARADSLLLERLFGSRGRLFQAMARGEDDRLVEPSRERKAVGAETTFARDLSDGPELRRELTRLAETVAGHLAARGLKGGTVVLKLRHADFTTITRQISRAQPTDNPEEIRAAAEQLLTREVAPGARFRLLGIQCTRLAPGDREQLSLWPQ